MRLAGAFVMLIFAVTFGPTTVFTATSPVQPNRLKNALLRKNHINFASKKVTFEGPRQAYEDEEEDYEDEEEEAEAEEELQQQTLNAVGDDYNEGNEGGEDDDDDEDEDEEEEAEEDDDEGRKLAIGSKSKNEVSDEALREIKIEIFFKQLLSELLTSSELTIKDKYQ